MKLWWVVLVLAACNQVLDLRATTLPDGDGDGVVNDDDNCPMIANPDQANRDGDSAGDACDSCADRDDLGLDADLDGIDDACDACARGPNHDEDGDGVFDACDVCPGIADEQRDADSDEVGDACERADGSIRERIFFDGFAPPSGGWLPRFVPWEQRGDDDYGPARLPALPEDGPYHPQAELFGTNFQVEAAVRTPAAFVEGDRFGLALVATDGRAVGQCTLIRSGVWRTNYNGDPVVPGARVQFRFVAEPAAGNLFAFLCEIDGVVHGSVQLAVGEHYFVTLMTSVVTEYHYFDALR